MTHQEVLEKIYQEALTATAEADYSTELPDETVRQIGFLVSRSEANKGLITVLITLLTHKIIDSNR